MLEESKFEVGSRVTWKSQSGSVIRVKTGTIIAVIPAGKAPLESYEHRVHDPALRKLLGKGWYYTYSPKNLGAGMPRSHESYLVAVPYEHKQFLYWPWVKDLQLWSDVESLAEYAHKAWSGWLKYMFGLSISHGLDILIPSKLAGRWIRQMNTPYADLPESEKEADRKEAREILALLR